jgi:hypothetical protein
MLIKNKIKFIDNFLVIGFFSSEYDLIAQLCFLGVRAFYQKAPIWDID